LWRFIERVTSEPLDEKLFRECFGLGYSDVRDRLSDYLPIAVAETITLKPAQLARHRRPVFRQATDVEIARIRGDWERIQINLVRTRFPELVDKYVEQARRTLYRAYHRGGLDAQLLGVLGLTEIDAREPLLAQPLLEAAARGPTVRPRVWLELARLRYARARERTSDAGGKLPAADVQEVLALLESARRQPPVMAGVYELMAEVWLHSRTAPTSAQLSDLTAGARLLPRDASLLARVIHLNASAGHVDVAAELAERGRRDAADASVRDRFSRLLAALPGAASTRSEGTCP
jgi:hypothetical protein